MNPVAYKVEINTHRNPAPMPPDAEREERERELLDKIKGVP
jgi:hypothetical protein